jgi:hypothetical protein
MWGYVDPDIEFEFVPLWELDEVSAATMRKTQADTDAVLVELGAIDADEVRQRIAAELNSPYAGLDMSKGAPGPPEQPGMEDGEGGEGEETQAQLSGQSELKGALGGSHLTVRKGAGKDEASGRGSLSQRKGAGSDQDSGRGSLSQRTPKADGAGDADGPRINRLSQRTPS